MERLGVRQLAGAIRVSVLARLNVSAAGDKR
jgi:two-component system, LuxR family, response regulator FixJ